MNLEIKTPAKINIGLNVIRMRPDGYHDIETIFYPVNLFDKIVIKESSEFNFTCSNSSIQDDPENLVIKAKNILEKQSDKKLLCHIDLEKNIPISAGLGGGSSDAAAVLTGLNSFFGLNIPNKALYLMSSELGADVPFFLNPKPSFAFSKGDELGEINFKINYPVLIVNPGIHVSTKWAYENIKHKPAKINLQSLLGNKIPDWISLKGILKNDFEEIVFRNFPEIGEIKNQIYFSGAMFALMTGSGSTVFGIFPDMISAERAEKVFKQKYFTFIHYG
ncbi:MAG TPA: 4-(cytidine 5'-diphospho)-2-C-methyl-D-erythritol kinase [Ignavibacteriaceae bacterium]|nr:4-(cytidine 5'-diphospho)-2-C-methyl-D-erythritol kinase [Ignavibacteriaceae bacterium]